MRAFQARQKIEIEDERISCRSKLILSGLRLGFILVGLGDNVWLFVLKNKVTWQVTSFSRDVFVERAELTAN